MIRLIRMDRQVVDLPDHREFALWCTVNDRFVEFAGDRSWECVEDLVSSMQVARMGLVASSPSEVELEYFIDRCTRCERLVRSVQKYLRPGGVRSD